MARVFLVANDPYLATKIPLCVVVDSIESIPERSHVRAVIFGGDKLRESDISWVRRTFPTAFISILDPSSSSRPHFRLAAFNAGANQVTYDVDTLVRTIEEDVLQNRGGEFSCPFCGLSNLSEDELWRHCPAYHINWPEEHHGTAECPICLRASRGSLQVSSTR